MHDARELTPYVAAEKGGAFFFLPTREKAGVDRFTKSKWKETRHLRRALEVFDRFDLPRRMFVDVGAHVGTTTITAVRELGFENAVAFEPEVENFRLLRANLGVNGLETRIRTFNTAVSNRVGTAELAFGRTNGTKHRLLKPGEVGLDGVPVLLTTLDAFVDEGKLDAARVSLLWLDIEGHELEALQGARQLLDLSVPIVMEFAPSRLADRSRLEELRALVDDCYTHVLDLRRQDKGQIPKLDALEELAHRYERGFTDLLLFREPTRGHVRRARLKDRSTTR